MHRHTVVPALPGFYVIEPVIGDSGPDAIVRECIVAWLVTYVFDEDDGELRTQIALPVTYDCAPWDEDYAIETPEGYVFPFDRSFGLQEKEKVVELFAKRWKEQQARRSKRERDCAEPAKPLNSRVSSKVDANGQGHENRRPHSRQAE
jgi:hypothetical protein